MKKIFEIKIMLTLCFAAAFVFYSHFSARAETGSYTSFNIISLPDNDIPYISIVELAETYNVQVLNDPIMLSMTARRGNNSLTIVNQSQTAIYNDTSVNIVFPARLIHGAMYAPVQTFLPLFSNLINGTLEWDEKNKRIDVSGVIYNIDNITLENREGGTLIGISLTEPLKCTDELTDNNWLHLSFADVTCDQESIFANLSSETKTLVEEIRLFQHAGETRFSFRVSDDMESYSIAKSSDPDEILISLRYKRTSEDSGPETGFPEISTREPLVNKELWTIDTVVIDPGHGGKDPGAVGSGGTKEKDIVLKVAKELKKIIDNRKEIKAVLTRDRDVFVPLRQRAAIADNANGKLFISIHANSHRNKRVSGLEVYFLSAAKTESAQLVADRENESILLEDNPGYYSDETDIFSKIFNDMASDVFLKESQYMCKLMLDKARSSTKQINRGVKQAGFYVMLGTQAIMPSVLFEIGYISNSNEETMLRRVSYQKRIANAMYDAIMEFKKQAERDLISRGE